MASFREPSTATETGFKPGRSLQGKTDVQAKTGEAIEQAQKMASERIDQLQDMIRRNPLAAAGIAAGIGFCLAILARR